MKSAKKTSTNTEFDLLIDYAGVELPPIGILCLYIITFIYEDVL